MSEYLAKRMEEMGISQCCDEAIYINIKKFLELFVNVNVYEDEDEYAYENISQYYIYGKKILKNIQSKEKHSNNCKYYKNSVDCELNTTNEYEILKIFIDICKMNDTKRKYMYYYSYCSDKINGYSDNFKYLLDAINNTKEDYMFNFYEEKIETLKDFRNPTSVQQDFENYLKS